MREQGYAEERVWFARCTHKGAPEMEDFALREVVFVYRADIASFLSIHL